MPTLTATELQIVALSLRVALVSMICSLPLAIVVVYFRNRGSIAVEDVNLMKG